VLWSLSVISTIGWNSLRAQNVITTFAGTDWIFPKSPVTALQAPLGSPAGMAVDQNGNIYLADSSNQVVVKISASGATTELTVVAGNGFSGYSGDGGNATDASLNGPEGVALDMAGNLYIADRYNHCIRMVAAGVISTVAGICQQQGDSDGPVGSATLRLPTGVAVTGVTGNYTLYIADYGNDKIRKVSDGTMTTFAGTGPPPDFGADGQPAVTDALASPYAVAVDSKGDVFLTDASQRIREVMPNGIITTVAGMPGLGMFGGDGGPATASNLNYPMGLALDSQGNLYVADSLNNRIREITTDGKINTVAGSATQGYSGDGGPAKSATLSAPLGVAVTPNGGLYIADTRNQRIRQVTGGAINTWAGDGDYRFSGDGGLATAAMFAASSSVASSPQGVAAFSGNVYISDTNNYRIREVTSGNISTIAGTGSAATAGDGGPASKASFSGPGALATDSNGNLFVIDGVHVREISAANGVIQTLPLPQGQLVEPRGLAVDGNNNLYIADYLKSIVISVSPRGTISTVAGNGTSGSGGDGGPATQASLSNPYGLAVDSNNNLYIADQGNNKIRKVAATTGIITTVAGTGQAEYSGDGGLATAATLTTPSAVAVDGSFNIYIADEGNHVIRKVANSSNTISTFAGNGTAGSSGDGGLATQAELGQPQALALDASGNLYIVDPPNGRVRDVLAALPNLQVSPSGTLTFNVPSGSPASAQTVSVTSSVPGGPFSISATTENGEHWLRVSAGQGQLPGTLTVFPDASGLAPGTYNGQINIATQVATPTPQTIQVTLVVGNALSPKIVAAPQAISFSVQQGSAAVTQALQVSNAGSGVVAFASTPDPNATWLSVAPPSSTANSSTPATVTVTVNPANLAPKTYTGNLYIQKASHRLDYGLLAREALSQPVTVPVTLTVTPQPKPNLIVTPSGLTFRVAIGETNPEPQCFSVLNGGAFTVSSDPTAPWLTATQGVCPYTSLSPQSAVPEVVVTVNPARLSSSPSPGNITVTSATANGSPQTVTVNMAVFNNPDQIGPIIRPNGLIFTYPAGGGTPGSLDIKIFPSTLQAFPFQLSSAPPQNSFFEYASSSNQSGLLVATPDITVNPLGSQPAGSVQAGSITVSASNYPDQAVGILAVIPPASSTSGSSTKRLDTAAACAPLNVIVTQLGDGSHPQTATGFVAFVGQPFSIEVFVADSCGVPMTNSSSGSSGAVVARLSNGDTPVSLTPLGDGRWAGAWMPANIPGPVQIKIYAQVSGEKVSGTAVSIGTLEGLP
jgi:sugar lactone lactonase YvrE